MTLFLIAVNSVACTQTATSVVSSVNAVANPSAPSNLQRSGNTKAVCKQFCPFAYI